MPWKKYESGAQNAKLKERNCSESHNYWIPLDIEPWAGDNWRPSSSRTSTGAGGTWSNKDTGWIATRVPWLGICRLCLRNLANSSLNNDVTGKWHIYFDSIVPHKARRTSYRNKLTCVFYWLTRAVFLCSHPSRVLYAFCFWTVVPSSIVVI